MLSLNERYGILSASYGTLREKFENYQNNHASPQLSSLIQMPETRLSDIPKHLISLDHRPLVRMMNSLSHRFVPKGESINPCERKSWIKLSDDSETQETKRRKPCVSEGLGLQAIAAAAASLYSDDAVPLVELSLRRSSLADLLYAANFNSCESNQASTRIMTALT